MKSLTEDEGSEWAATALQRCPDCGLSVGLSARPTTYVRLQAWHGCAAVESPDQPEEQR